MSTSAVSNLVEVGKVGGLKDGDMKQVSVKGHEILLAYVGGKYHAAGNRCPHMGGNLYQGKLEETVVTCPSHGSQFDLTDGHVVRWTNWSGPLLAIGKALRSPRPLTTYRVTVQDDKIMLEI